MNMSVLWWPNKCITRMFTIYINLSTWESDVRDPSLLRWQTTFLSPRRNSEASHLYSLPPPSSPHLTLLPTLANVDAGCGEGAQRETPSPPSFILSHDISDQPTSDLWARLISHRMKSPHTQVIHNHRLSLSACQGHLYRFLSHQLL